MFEEASFSGERSVVRIVGKTVHPPTSRYPRRAVFALGIGTLRVRQRARLGTNREQAAHFGVELVAVGQG